MILHKKTAAACAVAVPLYTLVYDRNRKEKPMENRTPKNRYNGGINTESRKAQQTAGCADRKAPETLKKIEAEMDKHAADIAITVSDMFKFMAMSAAMLPNMEMDTGLFRLKVDDNGIFFEINHPFRKRKQRDFSDDCCAEEPSGDYDDDEEGLIYDGD